jgi:hypothetical protein
MTTPAPITRNGAQNDAKHELAKAIYHRNGDPLPVRIVRWFGHLVDRVLTASLKHAPTGGFGALALVVLVVVVVVVLIWRVGIPRRAASYGAVLPIGQAATAADHRRLAEVAADREDWHTAVVERMRAIARELEERSILEPRAGRTATELAREAGRLLTGAGGALTTAADVFNAVAYGGADATDADLTRLISADDLVRESSRSRVLAT